MEIAGGYHKPLRKDATKVFQGEIFSVWQWDQEQYDGSIATYEAIKRSDVSHTIGVLPDGNILLTHDEQPQREAVITPPGGRIEEDETPEAAAKREFLEETGYEIGQLVPWHAYNAGGKIHWRINAFIGRDLKKVADPTPEPGEKIELYPVTFDEFLELGTNPMMRDLVIRLILLEAQLNPIKKKELRNLLYG